MHKSSKIKISLFSGGTGYDRFVSLIKSIPGAEIDIIVNGYDDGKSTGEIRKFIPGILGPSDFRKNLSHLVDLNTNNGRIFVVDIVSGKTKYVLKIDNEKISRPIISGKNLFVVKDNAIIKLN